MKILIVITLFFCFCGINQVAFSQCANEVNIYSFTYAGVNYEIVKENQTWGDAAACAVERGGFLARIDSAGENAAIFQGANVDAGIIEANTTAPDGGGASYVWLGGTDRFTEGEWIWDGTDSGTGDQFWQGTTASTGGVPVGGLYSNWGDEPDDFGVGQDGLGLAITDWPLGVESEWNDLATTNTLYYVIEYPDNSGIEENETGFKIYPNPSKDILMIDNKGSKVISAKLISFEGKIIFDLNNPSQIDISSLADGTYTILFKFENGSERAEKFVK